MPSPNIPRIAEFLSERPLGASVGEIAEFLDTLPEYARESLGRMQSRGMVSAIGGTWYGLREPTPPVFHAMENLQAMQCAARR